MRKTTAGKYLQPAGRALALLAGFVLLFCTAFAGETADAEEDVDLKDLQTQKYMVGVGAVVAGDDGRTHRISNSGVAMHPNDEAMGVIASRLYTVISRYRAAHQ